MLLKRVAHNVPAVIPFSQPPVALSLSFFPIIHRLICRPDFGSLLNLLVENFGGIFDLFLLRSCLGENLFNDS